MSTEVKTWTVREVLEYVPQLGIPHFQRGLVWGVESRAALLESLFFDTPCGSFVLWEPKDCGKRGVPLDPSACTQMKYLVVDGQQRIRSLHSVFNQRAEIDEDGDETDVQDDTPGNGHKVWCINLTKVPDYARRLKTPGREFGLFVHTLDPAKRQAMGQPSPLKYNMLPLEVVLAADSWSSDDLAPYRDLLQLQRDAGGVLSATLSSLYCDLRKTVLAMKERVFFVSIQAKDDPAEMANLYNRINAGGKRVEIEERAFARLVGLQPNTYGELALLFEAVHPESPHTGVSDESTDRRGRNEVLQRQKERAFGFKLFIRVFLQVCQHHLGFRQSKNDFSFDLANKASFLAAFGQLSAEQSALLWAETHRVVGHVRSLLRDELACDDLRSLPDTSALTPVFQLLIHYPALRDERYRPLLAGLCLRLMLADLDSRTLLRLLHEAGDPGRVAFDVIPAMFQLLDKDTDKAKLSGRLEQANSIQSRYVLLLYWLERRLGAMDFLYKDVPNPNRPTFPELTVNEAAKPEKQHLLPFKKAQALYPGDLRRGGSHIVNGIGNLTYISEVLNSFERGLGDAFADLSAEPEANQRAHLLVGQPPDRRLLDDYENLRRRLSVSGAPATEKAKRSFERMSRHRRALIAQSFRAWVEHLDATACAALGLDRLSELGSLAKSEGRLEPAPPSFAPLRDQNVAHLIRRLDMSHDDEDRVIFLAQRAARVPSRKDDLLKRDLWLTRRRKRVWVKARPGRVVLCFHPTVSSEHRRQILDALELNAPSGSIPDQTPLKPVPDFQRCLNLMATLGPEIEDGRAGVPASNGDVITLAPSGEPSGG
jgi:hypothetical protein